MNFFFILPLSIKDCAISDRVAHKNVGEYTFVKIIELVQDWNKFLHTFENWFNFVELENWQNIKKDSVIFPIVMKILNFSDVSFSIAIYVCYKYEISFTELEELM